jgi:DNA-binding HxlR family transcriptional regulator
MDTPTNESSTPHLVRLSRPERLRARFEDFEMIERTRAALALLDSKERCRHHPARQRDASPARLVDNIPGLSKKVLTTTLRKLERDGIVSRQVYPEIPVRVEYSLTPLGWQLTEPLMVLYEWALAHESELAGLPRNAHDPQSGAFRRAPSVSSESRSRNQASSSASTAIKQCCDQAVTIPPA